MKNRRLHFNFHLNGEPKTMRMQKWILALIVLSFSAGLQAQTYQNKKKRSQYFTKQSYQYPLFKWAGEYKRHGIQVSFGPTYLLTTGQSPERELYRNTDSMITYSHNPSGRLAGFVEVGMVHITKRRRKAFHYFDWGIGYKHFTGVEQTRITEERLGLVNVYTGEGRFGLGYLTGRFNIHHVIQLGRNAFIDNAIGVNLDYRLAGNVPGDNSRYTGVHLPPTQRFQQDFVAQLNYEFGIGVRVRPGFYVVPALHTPILGIYEWTGGNPSLMWYSSRYQPLLFKVKLVWLFKQDPERCAPVYGSPEDEQRNKQYMEGK